MKTQKRYRLSANGFVWLCAGLSIALFPLMLVGALMLGLGWLCMVGIEKLADAMRPAAGREVQVTRYMPTIEPVERRRRMRLI